MRVRQVDDLGGHRTKDLPALAEKIRGQPGVEQVVAFGTTLHVSGRDGARLRASVGAVDGRRPPLARG